MCPLDLGEAKGKGNCRTAMMPDQLSGSLKPVGTKLGVHALNCYRPNSQPQARISPFADTEPREGVTLAWLQAQLEPLTPCPSTCPARHSSYSALQPLSGAMVDMAIVDSEKSWP